MTAGVYVIEAPSGKRYIGGSVRIPRLSDFNKERMQNPEVRNHLSIRLSGRSLTESHKQSIGAANKNRPPSESCIAAARIAQAGRVHSEEEKAKRVASRLRTLAARKAADLSLEKNR